MLISYKDLCKDYDLKVRGILHIGAHMCEELQSYVENGCSNILWIEGDPTTFSRAKMKYPQQNILNYLITDVDDQYIKFHHANNGQSSSILEFGLHKVFHSEVKFVSESKLITKRVDTIFKDHDIDENFANFLNIDIQGAELLALKSMGSILSNFDYVYLEVNDKEVYVGCALISDIDEYLEKYGFKRVSVSWTNAHWGDAFYMK